MNLTEPEIRRLTEGLLDHTLPKSDWRHDAHCLATAWLIAHQPEMDIRAELPGIISRYNVAVGGENTDTAGYHHTITLFYVAAISAHLNACADMPFGEACARMLSGPVGDKDFPLRYYSREHLFSATARREWVEPDLMVLDF